MNPPFDLPLGPDEPIPTHPDCPRCALMAAHRAAVKTGSLEDHIAFLEVRKKFFGE